MKKKFLAIVTAALIGTTAFASVASAASGTIDVISREDGSGTRGAFIELFGIEEKQGDEKVDMTTEDASITNSTSVMMTTVAGDENAIGYISLGSLNDTVKAVKIDGAEASAENVANDTYKVSRPFNIITTDSLSDAAQDFENYIMSSDGQQIVEDNGYIKVADDAAAYEQSDAEGKVVVAGSSSRSASKPPYSRISAHIAATRIATIQVSNIPDTPDPIFFRISTGVVCPPISIINAPDTIPVSNTTNTLIPTIPPINTSTYGIT